MPYIIRRSHHKCNPYRMHEIWMVHKQIKNKLWYFGLCDYPNQLRNGIACPTMTPRQQWLKETKNLPRICQYSINCHVSIIIQYSPCTQNSIWLLCVIYFKFPLFGWHTKCHHWHIITKMNEMFRWCLLSVFNHGSLSYQAVLDEDNCFLHVP
jgi:hypothetical protein